MEILISVLAGSKSRQDALRHTLSRQLFDSSDDSSPVVQYLLIKWFYSAGWETLKVYLAF